MNNTIKKSLTVFWFVSTFSWAHPNQGCTEDMVYVPELFEEAIMSSFIDMAFQHKAQAYSLYATLFNLCQQSPTDVRCGDEYQQRQKEYQRAAAAHGALKMAWTPEFRYLPMPTMTKSQLIEDLTALGYLKSDTSVTEETLVAAVNRWSNAHGIESSAHIFLLHAFLINVEALTKINNADV